MFWPQEIIVEVAEKLMESNGTLYMRNVYDITVVGQMSNKYSANTITWRRKTMSSLLITATEVIAKNYNL